MSKRDELAEIQDRVSSVVYDVFLDTGGEADNSTIGSNVGHALHAAGYRKPRIISNVEELDQLSPLTVVRSRGGRIYERQIEGPWYDGPHDWQDISGLYWDGSDMSYPATVLHEPEA